MTTLPFAAYGAHTADPTPANMAKLGAIRA